MVMWCSLGTRSGRVSPQTVASLWEVFRATLQRLHATQPQSERWLFGLGDAAYEVGQFRDAVRYDGWPSLTLVLPVSVS
jgi:hypothetical protein